jgi:2-dehydropantoate 2-reductase
LPEVVDEISKIATHDTIIIPLLNGFNIYDRIRSKIETGLVLPACIYLGGRKLSDGKCALSASTGMIYYGADPRQSEYMPTDLDTILSDAFDHYINITWQKDPYPAIWQKYMFNVAVNLTNAYSGKTLGDILADTVLRQMMKNILKETTDVVLRSGAPVPQDVESRIWDLIEKLPCNTKSSYTVDIDNDKARNEGDIFGTAIIELGKSVNVKTDTIEHVFGEIQKGLQSRILKK